MIPGIAIMVTLTVIAGLFLWSLYQSGFRSCNRCGYMFSGKRCPTCGSK